MTRIDHATEARTLLTQSYAFTSSDMVLHTGETKADVIAQAHVHATLALVEQQRIANLIAMASMADDDSKHEVAAGVLGHEAVWTLATTKMIGPDDEFEIVRPDIAAALGIEVAP